MRAGSVVTPMFRVLGVILPLCLWEANSYWEIYRFASPGLPPSFFPSILSIIASTVESIRTVEYQNALLLSVTRTICAFGLSGVVAIVFALLGATFRRFDDFLYYPVEFLRHLPAVAIVPIAIMLVGIHSPMKIFVAVFGCVFPIYVGAREGLKSVDHRLMLTARTYGWKGNRLLFGVMLPSAVPHIVSAAKISLAISLILVTMSEMLIGNNGLGFRLVESERTFNFATMYSETLLLGFTGLALNQGLNVVCKYVYFWKSNKTWTSST